MGRKKQLNPRGFPMLLLRALGQAYDDKNSSAVREEGIGFLDILELVGMTKKYADGDISTLEINDCLHQLKADGRIYEASYSRDGPLYKPTPEGLRQGRFFNHSWSYRYLIHPIRAHIPAAVLTFLVTILALHPAWLFGWR